MAELTQQPSAANRIFGREAGSKNGESERVRGSAGVSPLCPHCGSRNLWRDGLRYSEFGDVIQRWSCRKCGLRFSDPQDVEKALSTFEHLERVDTKSLKANGDILSNCQICVTKAEGTKNLAAEIQKMEIPRRSEDIKGKILEFLWQLKKEAYAEDTIREYGYILKNLAKNGADLYDPETVKDVIARQQTWGAARKNNVVKAYYCFARMQGLKAVLPKYKGPRKLPFIPAEDELDQLIAGCGHQMATFLQVLKETAVRCGEAWRLEWTDLDPRGGTLSVIPEKGSEPRVFKISSMLLTMLLSLPRTSERIFIYKSKFYAAKTFRKMRKRIAHKLGNPRMLKIHFHTFRHWKATMEYHKTRDILHVMRLLGHKNIDNTLIYTQLIDVQDDDYVCKAAKTLQEATQLIEGGFEYVTEMEDCKLFRKRK